MESMANEVINCIGVSITKSLSSVSEELVKKTTLFLEMKKNLNHLVCCLKREKKKIALHIKLQMVKC